jgi:hypothetical protein
MGSEQTGSLPDRREAADWDPDNDGFHRMVLNYDQPPVEMREVEIDGRASIHSDEDVVSLVLGNSFTESFEVATKLDPDLAERLADQLYLAAELARDGRKADVRT